MKYLIDTHIFIWSVLDSAKISYSLKTILEDSYNEIIVSSITFWEISIKTQLGKFHFGDFDISRLPDIAKSYDFSIYDPTSKDYATFHNTPFFKNHRDPFDRMIIHLAIEHQLPLLSCDTKFYQYEECGLQLIR